MRGISHDRPPIWLMRQAGRYLPEYRDVRTKAESFLDLCYTPALAAEVTLQPLRRFALDAAIVFSDILVVPDALGQTVRFEAGEGPVLDALESGHDVAKLNPGSVETRLAPVMETLERVQAALGADQTLIGFCGGPWTVATYMLGGRGSTDQAAARLFALEHPDDFGSLMDVLIEASAAYLVAQLRAGADVVQIFESWAANLDEEAFERSVVAPTRALVDRVRAQVPDAAIIGFPRGAATHLAGFTERTGVDALGLDHMVPLAFARDQVADDIPVQGNLDPLRLCAGGKQMQERVEEIIDAFADRPHIFNLGHGIVPQTPIGNVDALVAQVKGEA